MAEDDGNSTATNLIRMVLVSLCANVHQYSPLEGEMSCQFKPEQHYRLHSLKGKTLRLTTLEKMPLSGVVADANGALRGRGVAFDLIHEMQEKIGFLYNITLPKENIIGDENTGIIKLLKDKEVDMAVAFIPMLQSYRDYVSFSSALAEFEWVLLMARPTESATGSGLLAPFQTTVWILILMSLIVVGPTMYLIIFLRYRLCKGEDQINKLYPLPSCVWFVYGALMKQGSTLSPVSDSSRLIFATWWIFITILTSFYTANLTAFLTLSEFTLTIKTPQDIHTHKRQWMADKGGNTENLIEHDRSLLYLKATVPQYGRYVSDSVEDRFKRVLKGEIYISEKKKAQMMMLRDYLNKTERNVEEKDRCEFVLTPKTVLTKAVAFGYPKNSTLEDVLDPMLMFFVHGGIISHLLDRDLPLTTICPLNLASRERKLRNADLYTTYKVVGIGFASALLAFIGEVAFRFYKGGFKLNEIKTQSMDSEDIKNSFMKKTLFNNEKSFKSTLNDHFVISQYYNEMMPGNDHQYSHDKDYVLVRVQERGGKKLMAHNQPSTFLFQYTN